MAVTNPFATVATVQEAPAEEGKKRGLFSRLKAGLKKTHDKISSGLRMVLTIGRKIDDELIDDVEEQLYVADVGPKTVMELCGELREAWHRGDVKEAQEVMPFLRNHLKTRLKGWKSGLHLPEQGPAVILVAGVNGSGKTTSIGKMAHAFVGAGNKVLLAACDTFRAAAEEQLAIWSEWADCDIVRNESADPAAVAYDAAEKAVAGGYDVLIVDTAGRVHTRSNLMRELVKIHRVLSGRIEGAPHETLMVLDATTGQNGISQAIKFNEAISLSGIVLAKLDGTAKGGIVLGMRDQIDLPVKLVGLGQQPGDIATFDPQRFVDALFE